MNRRNIPVQEAFQEWDTTRTLQRFAKATGMRLCISFEPDPAH
jgi:hypothetical protein